jgi:hypothetical protein
MPDVLPTLLHKPTRPLWLCVLDGHDWPCKDARTELTEEFRGDGPGLGVYLAAQLFAASRDLEGTPAGTPGKLFSRFLYWARPVRDKR